MYTLRRNCIHVNVRKNLTCAYFFSALYNHRPASSSSGASALFFLSHGILSWIFFQVVNSQRTGSGGGLATEGESIEVLHLDEKETKEMLDNETIDKPLGLIYALQWRQMKLAGLLWVVVSLKWWLIVFHLDVNHISVYCTCYSYGEWCFSIEYCLRSGRPGEFRVPRRPILSF